MGAVNDLCSRAILLNQGIIKLDGPTDKVIKTYVQQNMQVNINENYNIDDATTRRGTGEVRFVGIDTFDVSKNNTN
jgi:ABC-type multidrug transport system ATPase subunit